MPQHVILIPGFFGFENLGDLAYFTHARDALLEWCRSAGIEVRVHTVSTLPTASLRQRAAAVVEKLQAVLTVPGGEGPVHLVGHSSGGLDARLAITPELALPGGIDPEPLAAQVRSVVTVSAPHYGTPLAGFFSSLLGAQLLQVLSMATSYVLRTGRLPADVLVRMAAFFLRAASGLGSGPSGSLGRLHDRLLADFGPERRGALQTFAEMIARDQDLLPQITPAVIDVFNAATQDRPGVRYGCVVTQTRGAGLRSLLSAGLSPYAHASHTLYACLGQLAGGVPRDRLPILQPAQHAALLAGFSRLPARRANDGVVPTLSQVWGEVIRAVWADHLDVIGHFHHPTHVPPHFDWLVSGSGHTRKEFLTTWNAIATFLFHP